MAKFGWRVARSSNFVGKFWDAKTQGCSYHQDDESLTNYMSLGDREPHGTLR